MSHLGDVHDLFLPADSVALLQDRHAPLIMERLKAVGLSTLQTGMDNIRNVVGCPIAGLAANELLDASPIARQFTEIFLGNRDYTNLPRKVNVTVTGCRDNCTHPETQDIALIPAIRQTSEGKVAGFNVLAGGKLGSGGYRIATPLDAAGLDEMFKKFFPRAQTQRCQKHAKANACRRVRKKERELFSKSLNTIFYAPTESEARVAFFKVKEQWGRLFPSAVQVIEKDLNSLTFFQFDATYWTVLRTTNPIERLNKEFKRRTRAMEVTGGEISTYRCLVYVSQTMEYRWSFHPLSQWSTVYTQVAA